MNNEIFKSYVKTITDIEKINELQTIRKSINVNFEDVKEYVKTSSDNNIDETLLLQKKVLEKMNHLKLKFKNYTFQHFEKKYYSYDKEILYHLYISKMNDNIAIKRYHNKKNITDKMIIEINGITVFEKSIETDDLFDKNYNELLHFEDDYLNIFKYVLDNEKFYL